MTDNEKIARWQGWNREKNHSHWWRTPEFELVCRYPDYPTDGDAAIGLLNTLVLKGYEVTVIFTHNGATVDISERIGHVLAECDAPTVPGAVSGAVLRLIADKP